MRQKHKSTKRERRAKKILDVSGEKIGSPARLIANLGISRFYGQDWFDPTVKPTTNLDLQNKATGMLMSLRNPDVIKQAGLVAPYLLERGNSMEVVFEILEPRFPKLDKFLSIV